ncbi:hypothetical protein [Pseudoduganella albidiflava]|uniref:Uncharacterized protein n=1 Tax=Pseudoduganella albidiflava TaxID=321983 RepID=A0AA88C3R3_9BURK|nr:hypothetical protein [Pseudoduganella albidiflava]GGY48306.1 hypothetical protein GCM10007387_33090 [Pseudoduganella albidiflava]
MTEKNKPASENTESGTKKEPLAQPAESAPTAPTAPSIPVATLVPEEPNNPTIKG